MEIVLAPEHLGDLDLCGELPLPHRDMLGADAGHDVAGRLGIRFQSLLLEIRQLEFHAPDLREILPVLKEQLAAIEEIHDRHPNEARNEEIHGLPIDLLRGPDLIHETVLHDDDAVSQRHGLGLVMGHVHKGGVNALAQLDDLSPHLITKLRVQIRQRLVHQEDLGITHHRAANGHPLPLASGKGLGLAFQVLGNVQDLSDLIHLLINHVLRDLLQLQGKPKIIPDCHMRIESVALENHRDVPVLRLHVINHLAVYQKLTARDILQSRDHPESGRFPAAGRTHQHYEFLVLDLYIHVMYSSHASAIDLLQPPHDYF